MFDNSDLKTFIAVANIGSITKASQHINKSQSAVSQQISKLEELVEKELFERDKGLKLTHDGEIFLEYAKEIYALQQELFNHFKNPQVKGKVRFGVPEDFASQLLSEVLIEFSQTHPTINLEIDCDLTMNLFKKFRRKKLDLVLLKLSKPQDFPDGVEIWSEKLQWVGDKNLLDGVISGKKKQSKSIPLVLSPNPCVYAQKAIKSLNDAKFKWNIAFQSQSFASKMAAVRAGLGISVLPNNLIPEDLNVIESSLLTKIEDTHLSLLKHEKHDLAVNSLEEFVLKKI